MTEEKNEVTERGIEWVQNTVHSEIRGFTPHNTSIIDDPTYRDERVFVGIRKVLEANEHRCMDDENDRLVVSNEVFNWIKQNLL